MLRITGIGAQEKLHMSLSMRVSALFITFEEGHYEVGLDAFRLRAYYGYLMTGLMVQILISDWLNQRKQ